MSDIFDEIDEEVRREQFKKLWERYGNLFIALAVLVVLGVGGWQGYDYWRNKQAEQFGAQFTAAADLADKGKHAEAEKAFAEIAQKGTTGYRALAKLREAAEIEQRDPKAAVAAYDDIAKNSRVGQPLQDYAALRAGMLQVDKAPFAEVDQRLAHAQLDDDEHECQHHVGREQKGDPGRPPAVARRLDQGVGEACEQGDREHLPAHVEAAGDLAA